MSIQIKSNKFLNTAKVLAQIGLLMLIWWVSAFIQHTFSLPVSAGVIGLLILLFALMTGLFKLTWIKQGSDLILAELVLFFVPCVIGIVKYQELLLAQGLQLVASVVIGTFCVMIVTAYMVHLGFKFESYLKNKNKLKQSVGGIK